MSLLKRGFYSITLCLCLGLASTQALAINAKSGMWEWTTTVMIPGSPFGLPNAEYKSCITSKNLGTQPPGNDHCKLTSQTIDGDRVDWKAQCAGTELSASIQGHLIYNATTAMGESIITSGSSSTKITILGSYIGPCK